MPPRPSKPTVSRCSPALTYDFNEVSGASLPGCAIPRTRRTWTTSSRRISWPASCRLCSLHPGATSRTTTSGRPAVSLNWQATEDVPAGLRQAIARGYKAGGFNNSISSSSSLVSFDRRDPGRCMNSGMKSTWLDNRLRVNVAVFHMEYNDKQESSVRGRRRLPAIQRR